MRRIFGPHTQTRNLYHSADAWTRHESAVRDAADAPRPSARRARTRVRGKREKFPALPAPSPISSVRKNAGLR